jgi:hypothetical protein
MFRDHPCPKRRNTISFKTGISSPDYSHLPRVARPLLSYPKCSSSLCLTSFIQSPTRQPTSRDPAPERRSSHYPSHQHRHTDGPNDEKHDCKTETDLQTRKPFPGFLFLRLSDAWRRRQCSRIQAHPCPECVSSSLNPIASVRSIIALRQSYSHIKCDTLILPMQ